MMDDFMGKKLRVKITEAGKHYMKCELVQESAVVRPAGVPEPLKKGQVSGTCSTTADRSQTKHSNSHHPLLVVSLIVLVTSLLLKLYYSQVQIL